MPTYKLQLIALQYQNIIICNIYCEKYNMKVTDITSLARFILSEECKSICVLTGAGVSVASGIPDFRSPGGMYSTLNPDLLTASPYQRKLMKSDPTYVVTWDIFQNNQFPYMEVRKPFILGTYYVGVIVPKNWPVIFVASPCLVNFGSINLNLGSVNFFLFLPSTGSR